MDIGTPAKAGEVFFTCQQINTDEYRLERGDKITVISVSKKNNLITFTPAKRPNSITGTNLDTFRFRFKRPFEM